MKARYSVYCILNADDVLQLVYNASRDTVHECIFIK